MDASQLLLKAKASGLARHLVNRFVSWIVVLSSVPVSIGTGVYFIDQKAQSDAQMELLSNARQIYKALFEFDLQFGKFPDADTVAPVIAGRTDIPSFTTHSSNGYFRQLLAAGIGDERIFYTSSSGARKPDNRSSGSSALEPGECGFAYIPGFTMITNGDYPVVIAPLIAGTDRVDPRMMDGKVVIQRINGGSVMLQVNDRSGGLGVDKDGHVLCFGKRLLDPENVIWDGRPPRLVWPEEVSRTESLLRRIF